jgi:hypothetical protein
LLHSLVPEYVEVQNEQAPVESPVAEVTTAKAGA